MFIIIGIFEQSIHNKSLISKFSFVKITVTAWYSLVTIHIDFVKSQFQGYTSSWPFKFNERFHVPNQYPKNCKNGYLMNIDETPVLKNLKFYMIFTINNNIRILDIANIKNIEIPMLFRLKFHFFFSSKIVFKDSIRMGDVV